MHIIYGFDQAGGKGERIFTVMMITVVPHTTCIPLPPKKTLKTGVWGSRENITHPFIKRWVAGFELSTNMKCSLYTVAAT